MHQLAERAPRFIFQQTRRQIELDPLVQIFHDLRFLGALDLMLFLVLEIVPDHAAKIDQRFSGHQFGGQIVVHWSQHLLLDLAHGHCVAGLLAG